jgi:magnesium transporter
LVGEELKSSSSLAKIDFYEEYILIVLTLPIRERDGNSYTVVDREIDFVIGKNFMITARNDTIEQLEYFAKIFEANSILDKDEKIENAANLFYFMMKKIYSGMFEDLENIRDSLTSSETKIFSGDELKMVKNLSNLSRELIDFRQTARIHRDIWNEFLEYDNPNLLGKDFVPYLRDIRDQFNRVHELIGNCRELLIDLRETNDSLLNTKQNQIIKVLTLVAFIFYPLTFISALFTIPAIKVPFIGSSYGWMGILVFMVIITASIWITFKKKKWLQ